MKLYSVNPLLTTTFGTIFTIVVMNPTELAGVFITGAIGGAGAYLGTLLIKLIVAKAKLLFKKKEA